MNNQIHKTNSQAINVMGDSGIVNVAGENITFQIPTTDCPHCLGTGIKHVICRQCGETGFFKGKPCFLCEGKKKHHWKSLTGEVVKLYYVGPPAFRNYVTDPCPECEGSGKKQVIR